MRVQLHNTTPAYRRSLCRIPLYAHFHLQSTRCIDRSKLCRHRSRRMRYRHSTPDSSHLDSNLAERSSTLPRQSVAYNSRSKKIFNKVPLSIAATATVDFCMRSSVTAQAGRLQLRRITPIVPDLSLACCRFVSLFFPGLTFACFGLRGPAKEVNSSFCDEGIWERIGCHARGVRPPGAPRNSYPRRFGAYSMTTGSCRVPAAPAAHSRAADAPGSFFVEG